MYIYIYIYICIHTLLTRVISMYWAQNRCAIGDLRSRDRTEIRKRVFLKHSLSFPALPLCLCTYSAAHPSLHGCAA